MEPIVLYKLIVLQLLKKVNFPLTGAQLSEFFTGRDYTSFMTYQEVISDLTESNLIRPEAFRNTTRYVLTKEGEDVLYFFGKQLSQAVLDDIDEYISENKLHLRSETGVTSDYKKTPSGSCIVTCRIQEKNEILMELSLTVPDEKQAIDVCDNFTGANQAIYSYIMKHLL